MVGCQNFERRPSKEHQNLAWLQRGNIKANRRRRRTTDASRYQKLTRPFTIGANNDVTEMSHGFYTNQ